MRKLVRWFIFIAVTSVFLAIVGLFQSALSSDSLSKLRKSEPFYREARERFALGDFKRSAVLLSQVVEITPGQNWAWYLLGRSYYELGEYQKAEQALAKAEEILSLAPYLFERARALKALNRKPKASVNEVNRMEVAISKFQKASEMLKFQDKAMEVFKYAVRLEGHEDREICRRFESVIREIPDEKIAVYLQDTLVECYEKLAEYALAREAFAKYISLVEKTEGVEEADRLAMRKADEWFQDGEYAEAARWYAVSADKLTDRNCQDEQIVRALVKLRECYEKVSEYCDDNELLMVGHIKFISYECPWDEQVEKSYDWLRNLYSRNQDFLRIIQLNQIYLARYPNTLSSAHLQYQISVLYYIQGQSAEALSAFKKMVEDYPEVELAEMAKAYIQLLEKQ